MASGKTLHLYTVTWCPHCRNLIAWLDREGIPYEDHDVDESDADWQVALSLTGGVDMVPVAEVGGKVVWGPFTEEFRTRLLGLVR